MEVRVVYSKENQNRNAIETSIKIINATQNYYKVKLSNEIECCKDVEINAKKCCGCLNTEIKTICITDKKLEDNWFSHEYRNYSIISTYDWESQYAPPSLKAYIIFQIAQSLIHFSADLSEEMALNMVHYKSQGCMFDMCENKEDIKIGMVGGSVCPQCKALFLTYGISNDSISAVENLLEFVRFEAIGKPKLIDTNRAFIVMRFSKHDENDNAYEYGIKEALKELKIECIRADTEVRSSQILDKIKNKIERSRLIIAKIDSDNLNVYFELGYAMGQNKDVILIAESSLIVNLPSDLKNWECITYSKGDYVSLKNNLIEFLKQNYSY